MDNASTGGGRFHGVTLCSICNKPAGKALWCDTCLESYRQRGQEWERKAEANRLIVKRRRDSFGW